MADIVRRDEHEAHLERVAKKGNTDLRDYRKARKDQKIILGGPLLELLETECKTGFSAFGRQLLELYKRTLNEKEREKVGLQNWIKAAAKSDKNATVMPGISRAG